MLGRSARAADLCDRPTRRILSAEAPYEGLVSALQGDVQLARQDRAGKMTLSAVVTEATYVGADTAAHRTSKRQLRHTVQRIEDALFGDPGRLDRDLWLARIADLLLDGTTALGQSTALEAVRDGIQGAAPIDHRGYAHVFIAGPAEVGSSSCEHELISDIGHGLQQVFARRPAEPHQSIGGRPSRHGWRARRKNCTQRCWATVCRRKSSVRG